eukprot:TRINITY_DN9818_c0_g1_i13.p1 TRINITY_DN9818_c0_g1~~TRINITY_DN9818_c0_g1_i13.p1  ORF type:complete len:464 (-),score=79.96 TRINITY_DN9818_c0_g1_i13:151-1542(-)
MKIHIYLLFLCLWGLSVFGQDTFLTSIIITSNGVSAPSQTEYISYTSPVWNTYDNLLQAGARQHYLLGTELRSRYLNYIGENFNRDVTKIYATQSPISAAESAQALGIGLYPPGSGPVLGPNTNTARAVPPLRLSTSVPTTLGTSALEGSFQPLPVSVDAVENDILLNGFNPTVCPKAANVLQNNMQSNEYNYLSNFFQYLRPNISQKLRINESDLAPQRIYQLYEKFNADLAADRAPLFDPTAPSADYWKVKNAMEYLQFFQNPSDTQWLMAPMMRELFRVFDALVNGTSNTSKIALQKLAVYVGTDTTIAGILSYMNVTNYTCIKTKLNDPFSFPPNGCPILNYYANTISFELWQNGGQLQILMRVNDFLVVPCPETRNAPCTYVAFRKNFLPAGEDTYDTKCGRSRNIPPKRYNPTPPLNDESHRWFLTIIALILFIFHLFLVIAYLYSKVAFLRKLVGK